MHALVKINQYRERNDGTDLVVSVAWGHVPKKEN